MQLELSLSSNFSLVPVCRHAIFYAYDMSTSDYHHHYLNHHDDQHQHLHDAFALWCSSLGAPFMSFRCFCTMTYIIRSNVIIMTSSASMGSPPILRFPGDVGPQYATLTDLQRVPNKCPNLLNHEMMMMNTQMKAWITTITILPNVQDAK